MVSLCIIFVAIVIGVSAAVKLGNKITENNRAAEFPANEQSEPLPVQSVHWSIVHIRDDIGIVCASLIIISGTLAGILAAIILLLFR